MIVEIRRLAKLIYISVSGVVVVVSQPDWVRIGSVFGISHSCSHCQNGTSAKAQRN